MATTIKLKNSVTTTAAPSSLVQGEVATNITDKKVWVGDASSTPVQILGAGAPVAGTTGTFTGNTTVAGTFAANGGTTLGDASGDALTINSSAVSIPNGLNFTGGAVTLATALNVASGGTGLSSLTSTRIPYGNGTSAFSSSSNLTFNGTVLKVSTPDSPFTLIVNGATKGVRLGADSTGGSIEGVDNTGSASYQPLFVGGSDLRFTTSGTERMRITTAGNVGIGTSSPAEKLEVLGNIVGRSTKTSSTISESRYMGGAYTGNLFTLAYGYGDSTSNRLLLGGGTSTGEPATYISFYTGTVGSTGAGTERMRLDSSGNLGIGTSSPASKLQTYAGTSIAASHAIIGASATGYWDYSSGGNPSTRVLARGYDSSAVEQIRLDPQGSSFLLGGNVGIGTPSPSTKLEIYNATNADQYWRTSAVSLYAQANNTNASGIFGTLTNHPLVFWTNSAEKMRLDSSGNLGLGVTPSAWDSGWKAIDVGAVSAYTGSATGTDIWNNTRVTGGVAVYKTTATASFYRQTTGQHLWYNAPSGTAGNAITFTQAMTLNASGQLGIGDTNPSTRLSVQTASAGNLARFSDGVAQTLIIGTTTNGLFYNNSNSGHQAWQIGGTERMRIDSSGRLLVGTSSSVGSSGGALFQVSQSNDNWVSYVENTASIGGVYIQFLRFSNQAPNDSTSMFTYMGDNAGQRLSVKANGGLYNYSANNVNLSDAREKTNIELAGSYLDKICSIPVKTFNYIDQNIEEDDGLTLGVIAQDVEEVAPELVMESNWGTQEEPKMRLAIYQTDLQYALMKCIQEQQAIINDLKARIETLESK
jgi:hypothetical protein